MIAYAIGLIFQIVILILMVKEARKISKLSPNFVIKRQTAEYLIDELKKRKSEDT